MSNDNIDDIMNQKGFSASNDAGKNEEGIKPKKPRKKSKADKFSEAASENLGIMSEFTSSSEDEAKSEKKVLPKSSKNKKNATVADEDLEKIDKKELERAPDQYEDGSKKGLTVIGVIVIMALLIGSYFYFFSASAGPIIMLSNNPIHDVSFPSSIAS